MYFVLKVFKPDKAFAFTTHRFNIPTTYYPCPLFRFSFCKFCQLRIKTDRANPEMYTYSLSAVSLLHMICFHRPEGLGLQLFYIHTYTARKRVCIKQAKQYCQERVIKMTFLPCGFWELLYKYTIGLILLLL